MALSNSEKQRRYISRLKAQAAIGRKVVEFIEDTNTATVSMSNLLAAIEYQPENRV